MKTKNSNKKFLKILNLLQKKKYKFCFFKKKIKEKEVYLRHDIDFSLNDAVKIAKIEKKKKIFANFFFLISSPFYNIFNKNDKSQIKEIINMGHNVGLHFDPSIYNIKEVNTFLIKEIKIFNDMLNVNSKVFSLHRPRNFLNYKFKKNLINTYDNKFIKKIKYISDSGGFFNFEEPISWLNKNNGKSIQLLLHPIWCKDNLPANKKISNFYINKKLIIKKEILESFTDNNFRKKMFLNE